MKKNKKEFQQFRKFFNILSMMLKDDAESFYFCCLDLYTCYGRIPNDILLRESIGYVIEESLI